MTVPASEAAEALPVAARSPGDADRTDQDLEEGVAGHVDDVTAAVGDGLVDVLHLERGATALRELPDDPVVPGVPADPDTPIAPRSPPRSGYLGELTASSENPAGTDVAVGDALLVGDAVPVVAEVLGLGEEVGAVDADWVGVGLGGSSSEQPDERDRHDGQHG